MKKTIIFLILLASIATSSPLLAQPRNSVLQLWLRNNKMLTVVIDGRHYQRYGRTITYVDVPAGEHSVKVYQYIPYKPDPRYDDENTNNRGRAKLVYKGSIRTQPGNMYYCTIDPEYHTMSIRESSDIYLDSRDKTYRTDERTDFDENQDADIAAPIASTAPAASRTNTSLSNTELAQLGKDIQQHITTSDKLRHLKQYLLYKTYSTAQLAKMMSWLSIERSKLQLAEYSQPHLTDPQNIAQAGSTLELAASRRTLASYATTATDEPAPAPKTTAAPTIANDDELSPVIAAAQAMSTDTERQAHLTDKLASSSLSTTQLIRIIATCTFEGTKLELVKWAYPRLTDKENILKLQPSFAFLSSKKAIEQLGRK